MCSVTIPESGMIFGPYDSRDVFCVEQSPLYAERLRHKGIKSCEFILRRRDCVLFIEAKTSCPNLQSVSLPEDRRRKYDQDISDIADKMSHTLSLYTAMLLHAQESEDLPQGLREKDLSQISLRMILVVKKAEERWLVPLQEKLQQELGRERNIWHVKLVVINEAQARRRHLIV